jgi:hypothetical protein
MERFTLQKLNNVDVQEQESQTGLLLQKRNAKILATEYRIITY